MSLSCAEIESVIQELRNPITGRRIRKIAQLDEHTFVFWLKGSSGLLLSIHPEASRIHSVSTVPSGIPCKDFCRTLRKNLDGGLVEDIFQVHSDRVVRLIVRRGRGRHVLVAELMGRFSNVVLLDDEERIVGSMKGGGSSGRRFKVGDPYPPPRPPPERTRQDETRFGPGRGSIDVQVRVYYEDWLQSRRRELALHRLEHQARRSRKRLRRVARRIGVERDRAVDRLVHQRWADLILAHLHELPQRAPHVTVPDLYAQQELIEIPLDPCRTVRENAARYYKSARRARRTLETLEPRLKEIRQTATRLEDLSRRLAAASLEESEELEAEAAELGLTVRPSGAPGLRQQPAVRLPYRTYGSRTGCTILVGRSARDNHELTFHVARGRDMWLHVADAPGPHVIVRLDKARPIDQESLLDAAMLAVHFSSARGRQNGEVRYALRKHVRPIRGSPGRVTVAGGKTVSIQVDSDRLNRLLAQEDTA